MPFETEGAQLLTVRLLGDPSAELNDWMIIYIDD